MLLRLHDHGKSLLSHDRRIVLVWVFEVPLETSSPDFRFDSSIESLGILFVALTNKDLHAAIASPVSGNCTRLSVTIFE